MGSASKIAGDIENMVGDMAFDVMESYKRGLYTDDKELLDKMKDDGVMDIGGAYADHLFNDADLLKDLIGQAIFDSEPNDNEARIKLAKELKEHNNFPAWDEATKTLIRRFEEW